MATTAVTTAAMATTEARLRWWPWPLSVRFRITVAVVVLAGLALAGAGLAVFALEDNRLDNGVNESIERELQRFDQLQASADHGSAQALVLAAVRSSVPNPTEVVVAFWDGAPQQKLGNRYEGFVTDPVFTSRVNALIGAGGVDDIRTAEGTWRIAVKPVADAEIRGAVVYAYSLAEVDAELYAVMRTYLLVAGASLLVVAFGAYVVSGRLLSPIRDLKRTAHDISESDLTRRITASGNDDLTDLTVTFNAMLDRLDGAFSTQRQFLDDVGHELKTPITIVRGHLELMDRADRDEVAATRDLVLDEMDRMGRLVEELILLAKTRRPDFLHVQPTDLGGLTDRLLDKMRGLGRRDWRVDVRAEAVVSMDPQRITQAVLQLAFNAVRHTGDGQVIAVGSRIEQSRVSIWVRDEGSGVAVDQQARIFERFKRADDRVGGSGLGLSIVRGIAEAHGGDAAVASRPGRGATFTITLPRDRPW